MRSAPSAQIESHSHVKYARFEKRCTKKFEEICEILTIRFNDLVTPINKRTHCILICFTWLLVHMFLPEYVYVVVFIHEKRFEAALMCSSGTHLY